MGGDGGAFEPEGLVSAGVVAVVVGVDHVADRLVRHRGDRRLDLVVQRGELAVDQDHPVVAGGDGHVAALALEHPGAMAEVGGLDLDGREVWRGRGPGLLRQGRSRQHRRRRSSRGPCPAVHTSLPVFALSAIMRRS